VGILLLHNASSPAFIRHPLRYLAQTLLTVGLFQLEANFSGLIVLYFVLSGEVMAVAPRRQGYFWVMVWGLLTIVFMAQLSGDIPAAMLNGLGALCGYLFIGSAASAQLRAEEANTESRRLLAELQTAHRQLQDYAARAEEWAVAQERNRLAREVHDTLGHRLTVAAVQLEGAQRLMTRDPERAASMVETVRAQVLEGLNELRRTVAALRAPLEAELSLPHALMRLANNFQEATGIAAHLHLPTEVELALSDEQRHTLFRTAQEALTNVQRHAKAKNVWLWLTTPSASHPYTQLTVEDDGCGLPTASEANGYGLRGLRERAAQLHSKFNVTNRPGGGARVTLTMPLAPEAKFSKEMDGNRD
jgi:signal transduction histidine kinase